MGDVGEDGVPARTARRVGIRALIVVWGAPMALGEMGVMGEVAGGILTESFPEVEPRRGLAQITCEYIHIFPGNSSLQYVSL